jgi:hypothetical protein
MSSPVRFARKALRGQLATGLNNALAISCETYNVPPWTFDFSDNSNNVFEAYLDYGIIEDAGIPDNNLLTIYGVQMNPAGAGSRIFSAKFSGSVSCNVDMFIGVASERLQTFENWADAAEDAMVSTVNNLQTQGIIDAGIAGFGKVYLMDVAAKRQKVQYDGENWIVPIGFSVSFDLAIS